ncbi:ATP-binding protein [Nitrospina gracilis]|uniref:ATP-binding protein n=1 Tax=Nitrospina gracilis TaxID=35801 RepID=UPI001F2D0FA7|nr:ATP-binding protein [Nitrospina gracilis]MCF8721264.1 signal transduction histidine kinase [Nitrospina gracilis Nb-211]
MNSWHVNGTLEVTSEFLREVLEASSQGMVCTNSTGMVVWVNRSAEAMLSGPYESLEQQLMDSFIAAEDMEVYREALDRQVKAKVPPTTVCLQLSGYGRKNFDAVVGLSTMVYGGAILVIHAIQAMEHKAEEAPVDIGDASSSNAAGFEKLMNRLSHHLPGPVGDVVVLSYQALRRFEEDGDRGGAPSGKTLDRAVGELARLLAEMGLNEALVPGWSPKCQKVVLDQVVSRVEHEFGDVFQTPPNRLEMGYLPVVEGDPEKLYLLFRNLVANAVAFRKKKTPLVVTLDSFQGGNGVWHILIKDNGIGFNNEDSDRIFQPFVQLGPAGERLGSGLGLTVCQRIVTEMGGKISALSEKGEGTTVILTFPGRAQ